MIPADLSFLSEHYRYIVIEGNIGAGKTSLAHKLASDTGALLVLEEFAENTFLPQFYKDPVKYAFPLELSFLAARFKQLKQQFLDSGKHLIISDYHIRKSLLFAQTNLEKEELELFQSFYDIVTSQLREPDLVIYLDKGVNKLKNNISSRGRDFENNISETYLLNLQHAYHSLLQNYTFPKQLIINSENMDFVNNQNDYEFIINKLATLKD
ncbi:MAG: deoxynucleoside kinase [Bacteroidota bacterium]|nr:deoxynucleoside kinase [Bacteroidota bacterium]